MHASPELEPHSPVTHKLALRIKLWWKRGKTTVFQLRPWHLDLQEPIKYCSSAEAHLLLAAHYQTGVFALREARHVSWCFTGTNPF